MSLTYINQQVIIYIGTFLIITGIIGNSVNILIFSTKRTYRQNSSAFYFFMNAIFNIIYIATSFIPNVVIQANGYDLAGASSIWCKIRAFFIASFALLILACSCLAPIDQYFVTSQNVRLRRLSNIKFAHRIVSILVIICMLHGIIPLVYYDISPVTKTCGATSLGLGIYAIVYFLGLITIIPSTIMLLFGYLTFRNIHLIRRLAEQQADRQLIRMVFIQVALDLVCIVPYGLQNVYLILTSTVQKDPNRRMIEGFISTVLTLVGCLYFSGGCYVFLMTSSRFRQATKDRLFCCLSRNRVGPI